MDPFHCCAELAECTCPTDVGGAAVRLVAPQRRRKPSSSTAGRKGSLMRVFCRLRLRSRLAPQSEQTSSACEPCTCTISQSTSSPVLFASSLMSCCIAVAPYLKLVYLTAGVASCMLSCAVRQRTGGTPRSNLSARGPMGLRPMPVVVARFVWSATRRMLEHTVAALTTAH